MLKYIQIIKIEILYKSLLRKDRLEIIKKYALEPIVNLLKYYVRIRYFFISWILLPATDYNGHRRVPLSCSIKRRNCRITSSITQPIKLKLNILL